MLTTKHIVPVVLVCFTLGFSSLSFGEDQLPSTNQVSPELRKDMANMHQKMADCLEDGSVSFSRGMSAQGRERLPHRCEGRTVSD